MKRRTIFLLVLLIACMIVSTCCADGPGPLRIQPGDSGTVWQIKSISTSYTNNGSSWETQYCGYPASEEGEVDSFSFEKSYNASISGTFGVSKRSIEASVGFSAGQGYSYSISRSSRPLHVGEYVIAQTRKYYQKYTIYQECVRGEVKCNFDENGNPTGYYMEFTVVDTAVAYAYKPLMPQIRLLYYYSAK